MTKIFDIVHLNEHMYAVDKKQHIEEGIRFLPIIGEGDYGHPIIATTDTSLGLPLLPEIETKNIESLALKQYPIIKNKDVDGDWNDSNSVIRKGFIKGYKAASAKKYTEEQVRNAILKAWDKSEDTKNIDEIIQSLNTKPIQVEVEMDYLCNVKRGSCDCSEQDIDCQSKSLQPVVFHEGYVKVKQWIYEERI